MSGSKAVFFRALMTIFALACTFRAYAGEPDIKALTERISDEIARTFKEPDARFGFTIEIKENVLPTVNPGDQPHIQNSLLIKYPQYMSGKDAHLGPELMWVTWRAKDGSTRANIDARIDFERAEKLGVEDRVLVQSKFAGFSQMSEYFKSTLNSLKKNWTELKVVLKVDELAVAKELEVLSKEIAKAYSHPTIGYQYAVTLREWVSGPNSVNKTRILRQAVIQFPQYNDGKEHLGPRLVLSVYAGDEEKQWETLSYDIDFQSSQDNKVESSKTLVSTDDGGAFKQLKAIFVREYLKMSEKQERSCESNVAKAAN